MGPVVVVGIVAAVIGLVAAGSFAAVRAEKRRVEEVRTVAGAMGFTFQELAPADALISSLGSLPLFDRGHSRRSLYALDGEIAGTPVVLMDYRYVTGSGKNHQIHTQTVAVFTRLGRGLPELELCPEHILHRIGQVFGYQDIDFDTNEEFSRQYLLRGPDESAIRAAFGPEVLAFLAGQPGWSVQAREGRLAVFREGKRAKPPTLPAFLADALRVAGTLSPRGVS